MYRQTASNSLYCCKVFLNFQKQVSKCLFVREPPEVKEGKRFDVTMGTSKSAIVWISTVFFRVALECTII